jgi:hypothetical protein
MGKTSSVLHTIGMLLGGVWIVLGSATPAHAHAIACGDVLGPGETFQLEADLDCSGGLFQRPALILDGATLDLNGYAVICHRFHIGCMVLTGEGARLLNGTVGGSTHEVIVVGGIGGHAVRNVTLGGADGPLRLTSDNNVLINVRTTSAYTPAFRIMGHNNRLRDNVVGCRFVDAGCIDVFGNGNLLVENVVTFEGDPGGAGFSVRGSNNRLTRNVAVGGGDRPDGIRVSGTGNVIENNVTLDNEAVGGDGPSTGILVSGTGNVIRNNVAVDNDLDLQDTHGECVSNTWRRNTFETSDPPCIE